MSRIEDLLRDTFQQLAASSPTTEGIAEQAIARARRVRRGRMVASSLAAVVCVALVSLGVAAVARHPGSVVGPAETVAGPTVRHGVSGLPDLLIDDRLWLADGEEIRLTERHLPICATCSVSQAWRVSDGWLVTVHDDQPTGLGTSTLWHVPKSGLATPLVSGEGWIIVTPGNRFLAGIQVVWVAYGRLRIGTYKGAKVAEWASTLAPFSGPFGWADRPLVVPQAVVGDVVVLVSIWAGGGEEWSVWQPSRGHYGPPAHPITMIEAITSDRERLIARTDGTESTESCLAEIPYQALTDPSVSPGYVCPPPLSEVDKLLPSPDDRWWVVVRGNQVALYRAENVLLGEANPAMTVWPPSSVCGVAWLDDDSFVVLEATEARIVHMSGESPENVPLSVPADTRVFSVVADLR